MKITTALTTLLFLFCSLAQAAVSLPLIGDWEVAKPTVVSDDCGVARFKDVTEFIPTMFAISNATESGFDIPPTYCIVSGSAFICQEIDVEQTAIRGADFFITTQLSGEILEESTGSMDAIVDAVIKNCTGQLCGVIGAVLSFPCPVQLRSQAVKL